MHIKNQPTNQTFHIHVKFLMSKQCIRLISYYPIYQLRGILFYMTCAVSYSQIIIKNISKKCLTCSDFS